MLGHPAYGPVSYTIDSYFVPMGYTGYDGNHLILIIMAIDVTVALAAGEESTIGDWRVTTRPLPFYRPGSGNSTPFSQLPGPNKQPGHAERLGQLRVHRWSPSAPVR